MLRFYRCFIHAAVIEEIRETMLSHYDTFLFGNAALNKLDYDSIVGTISFAIVYVNLIFIVRGLAF